MDGLASSALQGVKCLCSVSGLVVIVRQSSVRSLDQSFSVIVTMLSGDSSLTFLMIEKRSGVK